MNIDPLEEIKAWMANENDISTSFATSDSNGRPSCRYIAYGGIYKDEGVIVYTDSTSRKAVEFTENPYVALALLSLSSGKQIRVEGLIHELPRAVISEYFYSLSREIQITLTIGNQSKPIGSREEMLKLWDEIALKYSDPSVQIPIPVHWAGYCVVPYRIEFWQSTVNWLADRLEYHRNPDGTSWSVTRLLP